MLLPQVVVRTHTHGWQAYVVQVFFSHTTTVFQMKPYAKRETF